MEGEAKFARPYAVAAFQQAREEKALDRWSEMLATLSVVASDRTVTGLVASPHVRRDELADLIIDICGDRLTETGRNFVRLLAEYRRLQFLPEIGRQFQAERDKMENRVAVHLTSAHTVSDAQRDALAKGMRERLGREVDVTVDVDESLIGGAVIRAGDTVIDASVRGQLAGLERALA
ncbi:MAG: F0F1 ATP synthase subunit delta [Ectothiorhodospiraceae bacterium]|nr:F0F1 ATP synthase subunit delta [Ectothiorhodospiraceae bacterium]